MRKIFFSPAVVFAVILLDYFTKWIIETRVHPREVINVLPFLNIVNVKNTGAAFGMLSGLDNRIFIAIAIIAIILVITYILKTTDNFEALSVSLILGGAVGNLLDRLKIGKVVDFIDFFAGEWHWPAFNVADSALTIGIILFVLANIRHSKKVESRE
ncbi:MAG TPA: signal peptidase II [Nitrospirae bacterium]|nr:lipoprotein signal peptidase [bacterium BMS3Abin10]GBE38458.1 lipoprotein signal peptidase [bacterium BMS3Bbin08]HDO25305.1 signal peptidase II [Nitrospirota bacterium]